VRLGRTQDPVRALIAVLATVVLVATSACSDDDDRDRTYAAQTATIGESLAVLGWNISVAILRFDADYVLIDVDASPAGDGAHAKPEDLRFGLYGALAHPIESNGLGGCRDVTSLNIQPLSGLTPERLTGTVCLGPLRDRGGPLMVLVAPTLPPPGLSHACSVYGASVLVLPDASRVAVAVRASLCTQGEINTALLYATVSVVGTHAGLRTTRD
jgi:hypothetical protein